MAMITERLRELLEQAAALPPEQRPALLDEVCGDDAELRAQVQSLLDALEHGNGFLENPTVGSNGGPTPGDVGDAKVGSHVGRYKLLQQIGEGGFGVVFMAEQEQPVRRTVALKIIKLGMETRQVLARFEAERQALAMMDHPSIAKVFDGGSTEAGRPYFVMELVRGAPITEYCDKHQLSTRQRLDLFVQVCQAVQHAHQKGIIHRDLKPTNVLVTLSSDGKPVPKVIDFGIAKATLGQRLTDRTLFTEFRQLLGTPQYMSPEQAESDGVLDLDTRSDVYALGVLLYELLTGTTPFEKERLAKAGYEEVRRILRDEEPPRPSTRLSTMLGETLTTVSANRQTDAKQLGQLVHGELDWIVMKALEKDRTRRYETASGLAHDVERYLSDEPVEACPPSRVYRLRKFARRNKAAIATGAAIAIVLVVATMVSSWQVVRATRAERVATEQAAIAQAVNDFLNQDVLGQASATQATPQIAPDPDLKVRDALDRAAQRIAGRFDKQPLVEAAVRQTIGEAYLTLAQHQKAEEQLNEALRLRRKILGDDAPDTCETQSKLGHVYREQSRFDEAAKMYEQSVQGRRKSLGPDHPKTLTSIVSVASIHHYQGHNDKAESLCLQVMEANRRARREHDESTRYAMNILGNIYSTHGEHAKAEKVIRDVGELDGKLKGPRHPDTLANRDNLVQLYLIQNRPADAEGVCLPLLDDERMTYGSAHPRTIQTQLHLVTIKLQQGNGPEAERILAEAEEQQRKLPPEQKTTSDLAGSFCKAYWDMKQYEKAESLCEEILEARRRQFGPKHLETLLATKGLGGIYLAQGKLDKAQPLLEEAANSLRTLFPDHDRTIGAVYDLGVLYWQQQKYRDAEPLLREALTGRRKFMGRQHPNTLKTQCDLAIVYERLGDYDKAEALYLETIEAQREAGREREPNTFASRHNLGTLYVDQKRFDKAEQTLKSCLADERDALGATHPTTFATTNALADLYKNQNRNADAQAVYRDAIAGERKAIPGDGPQAARANHELARRARGFGLLSEAEELYREAVSLYENPEAAETALHELAGVVQLLGRADDAEKLYRQALTIRKKAFGEDSERVEQSLRDLTDLLRDKGSTAKVEALWRDHAEVLKKKLAAANPSQRQVEIGLRLSWALINSGQFDQAKISCRSALAANLTETDAESLNSLAWRLAQIQAPHRDPPLAVELAEKAVELAPKKADFRNTLGVARYRNGDFKGAVVDLEKTIQLRGNGGDGPDYFFLAMAQHRLGDAKAARQSYDKGLTWVDQRAPQNEELRGFRAEAEEVLGIASQPATVPR